MVSSQLFINDEMNALIVLPKAILQQNLKTFSLGTGLNTEI